MKELIVNITMTVVITLLVASFLVCFVAAGSHVALVLIYSLPFVFVAVIGFHVYEYKNW